MDILTRFELRKIMRRKSFFIGITLIIVVALLGVWALVSGAYITDKDGNDLKGLEAIPLRKEYNRQLAGPLTIEKIAAAVKQHQKVIHDPKNLNEKGELTNEAYVTYKEQSYQIDTLIRFAFSHSREYDHYIIDSMTPNTAKTFYQERLDKVKEYIDRDYTPGNASAKENAFFMRMNKSIPVPFQMDYVTGWENVFENLQFVLLISAFVIAIWLAPVFAGEYQSGADAIILSSRYGRNKVIAAKLKAGLIVSLGLLAVGLGTYTLLMLGIFGFDGGSASVQMIKLFAPVPFTVFQTYLWAILIGSLACLTVGAVTLWLSSRMSTPFPVIIVIVILLIGPLFFPASKSSRLYNHIMNLLPGKMVDGITRVTEYEGYSVFGQLIPSYKFATGFAIIVIALLLPFTYRAFKNHQVV
ncbi:hypothetical protein [Paenibacillus sp. sgz500992]|uniref:hypothetical protein n=1 Tax=Paenibacillus sp. sgz500992 TaxID=3242476 RepID=UPI0036D310EB